MSEFTKGKWGIDRNDYSIYSDSEDCCVADLYPVDSNEQLVANARLIAAAPDMYDELYDALQLLKGKSSWDGDEFSQQAKSIQELLSRIDGKEVRNNE